MTPRRLGTLLLAVAATATALLGSAATAVADGVTNSGSDARTGWYPDQAGLTPQSVSSTSFGELWSADVRGQIYAQPLVANGTLFVASETNDVYGLSPATGAVRWHRNFGAPWKAADVGCPDLAPDVGITATPVIDEATRTAYFTSKTYASGTSGPARWLLHAVDVTTGESRAGFPVELAGKADNANQTFTPTTELQRPGLLLMDGVVYAAFGGHCDIKPWQGWVFGVSTSGQVRARWVAVEDGDGAGIWQSGAGLTSDRPGSILLGTGNGGTPRTGTPGNAPAGYLGEAVVRLQVRSDGKLEATDFFAPFDAAELDTWDADFGSGGAVALPQEPFGTADLPRLAVAVGKAGYVYLLNRDDLGGMATGPGGSDRVVQRIGPYGGVWSRPGVWPGDGGYVFIPSASGGSAAASGYLRVYKYGVTSGGRPALSLAGTSEDAFGFGSGAPVVTSNGTASGSALVWTVWAPAGNGQNAQLRVYDPVPVGGRAVLRRSWPIGTATKFAMPGVHGNRLFVGTRDGKVRAFGSPVDRPLDVAGLAFAATTIGESTRETLTLTANQPVTVNAISSGDEQFHVGDPSSPLPVTLAQGEQLTVPVTFAPNRTGPIGGMLTVRTGKGDLQVDLTGTGRSAGPDLEVDPPVLSFGGTRIGGHLSGAVTLRNAGAKPLTLGAVELPSAPFDASDAPGAGDTIAPGDAVTVTVDFSPSDAGTFVDALRLSTDGGDEEVGLTANAGDGGHLVLSDEDVEFGQTTLGATIASTFRITNEGDTAVTVTKSKPPIGGDFTATSALPEGTSIAPGQTIVLEVEFEPTAPGVRRGTWILNGDDDSGLHEIRFFGTGAGDGPQGQPMTGLAGKCADVWGAVRENGTPIHVFDCNGGVAQQWTGHPDGTIRALGKCLDVKGGGTQAGTGVQLWECNDTATQRWRARTDGTLVNVRAEKCLDVTDGNVLSEKPLQVWECNGTPAQRWRVPPPRGPVVGLAGKCVDVDDARPVDGARVQLWTCNGSGAQHWTALPDGTVRALGKCLDVAGAGTEEGTRVQLWQCNGTAAQRWKQREDGALVNPHSGRCLDVLHQETADGTPVHLWDCHIGASQDFNGPGARGPVVSVLAGSCVDVAGGGAVDGTPVQLWACNGTAAQRVSVGLDGTLRVLGKCLDAQGGGAENGTPVQLWHCNGTGAQRWQQEPFGRLLNPASGRCLDVVRKETDDGARLHLWDCHDQESQRWVTSA